MDPNIFTETAPPKPSLGEHIIDFIQTLVVFAVIGTIIYLFIAQPHKVSGSSMFPNFHDGDYIITDKVTYKITLPKRGDVIVFKNPRDESQDFIKRIIGKPGDRVRIYNGNVYVNDQILNEPYLPKGLTTKAGAFIKDDDITVPSEHYLVFGDNRNRSSDSREWGYIAKGEIIGKVFLRYWPKESIGIYPSAYVLE